MLKLNPNACHILSAECKHKTIVSDGNIQYTTNEYCFVIKQIQNKCVSLESI